MEPRTAVHANCVILAETGILIFGPPGAGKSSLCLATLELAKVSQQFAALVSDDRVWLTTVGAKLMARPTPGFEGLIERRGQGITYTRSEPAAIVGIAVELFGTRHAMPRTPDEADLRFEYEGVAVPKFFLDLRAGVAAGALALFARLVRDTKRGSGGIANFA